MVDVVSDCGATISSHPIEDGWPCCSRLFRFEPFVLSGFQLSLQGALGIRINSGWHQVQRIISVGIFPVQFLTSWCLMMSWKLFLMKRVERKASSIPKGLRRAPRGGALHSILMGIPSVGSSVSAAIMQLS
jgi:hypothetical protein